MELWQAIHFVPVDDLVELGRHAEGLGFTGVAFGDHQVMHTTREQSTYPYSEDGKVALPTSAPFPDPWVAAAAMAVATKSLRFSTHVYILPLRDPFTVAKSVATASVLSGGRVEIGVGVGWQKEEFDAAGVDFSTRGRRTDEMLTVIQALWSGGPISHDGEFYGFDDLELTPIPSQSVPILVGGHTEVALRRAALYDGWIPIRLSSDESWHQLARVRELRRESGRGDDSFQVQAMCPRDGLEPVAIEQMFKRGATSVVAPPMAVGTSLSEWKRYMERTAAALLRDPT